VDAAPALKKQATGKSSTEPSHSSDDVTTAVASTSRGTEQHTVAEDPASDDAAEDAAEIPEEAEKLAIESSDNLSGSEGEGRSGRDEGDPEEEDEDDSQEEEDEEDILDEEDEEGNAGGEEDEDDDDSYDSHVEGDVQTNVDGLVSSDKETLQSLRGVKFFDDEVHNAARSNINKLLRSKRYHDDDVSEPLVRRSVGPRCVSLLPFIII
jgi:hypothetical protein